MDLVRSIAVNALVMVLLGCSGGDEESGPPVEPPLRCEPGSKLVDSACVSAGLPPDMPCQPAEWLRDDGVCVAAGVPQDGCGNGFMHDGDRGCEPILPDAPCPAGFMAVPGETDCREVAPCGSGQWGDIPVEPNTEYVDASYAGMDSDGTALKPWTTIQTGIDMASAGAIVAIAEGSYNEDLLVMGKAVRLWGVCPARAEVVGTGAEITAIQVLTGAAGTEMRNLAVTGNAGGIMVAGSLEVLAERVWLHDNADRAMGVEASFGPTALTLSGSLFENNAAVGLFVLGSEVTVDASVIRNTELVSGSLGRGVNVQAHPTTGAPATLVVRGSLVEANHELGVLLSGADATIEGSIVRDTRSDGAGLGGRSVSMQSHPTTGTPSTLSMQTCVLEQSHEFGLFVGGSQATVETTVIRATLPEESGNFGRGFNVQSDAMTGAPASAVMRASLIEESHEAGVYVAGADVTVEASVVRDTVPGTSGDWGRGVNVQTHPLGLPSRIALRGSLVERNHETGVWLQGSEATIDASVVRDTQPDASGLYGSGVDALLDEASGVPSKLQLRASIIEQNYEVGVLLAGSEAAVEWSILRAMKPQTDGKRGRGLSAQNYPSTPSTLVLTSTLFEQNHEAAVAIFGSNATIDACILRDTSANMHGEFGHGVMVAAHPVAASASITATRIHQSLLAAVAVWGPETSIGGSALSCQAFDFNIETFDGNAPKLEDLGENLCGCPEPTQPCKALSAGLVAPAPLQPPAE